MSIRIEKLSFIAGKKPFFDSLEFSPGTITILLGPNNSGKSQALRDIEALCLDKSDYKAVIHNIEMSGLPQNRRDTERLLDWSMTYPQPNGDRVIFRESYDDRTKYETLSQTNFEKIHEDENLKRKYVVPHYLVLLKGRTRFNLIDPEKNSQNNIQGSPLRFLWKENLNRLNKIIKESFNKYIIRAIA